MTATNRAVDDDIRSQVDQLKEDLGSMKNDIAGIARALVNQGKASAVQIGEQITHRLNDSVEQGRHVVREHPLSATMSAFGVGMLAGFLLCRR